LFYDSLMRSKGTAAELEQRRRLAVQRAQEGWLHEDIADFLGVHLRTVGRWVAAARAGGDAGLAAKPHPGRKPFLTPAQEAEVLSWLADKPTAFGYPTDLWTCRRLADLIRTRLGVAFHPNYLHEWLSKRGLSPQKPALRPRQRDDEEVAAWLDEDWPRIQKKPPRTAPTSC